MSPAAFDAALAVAQLLMIFLKVIKLIQTRFYLIDFFSALFWRSEDWFVGWDVLKIFGIQHIPSLIKCLNILINRIKMVFTILFVISFALSMNILKRTFIAVNLHWWGTVLHVNVFCLLVFVAVEPDKAYTWPNLAVIAGHKAHKIRSTTTSGADCPRCCLNTARCSSSNCRSRLLLLHLVFIKVRNWPFPEPTAQKLVQMTCVKCAAS